MKAKLPLMYLAGSVGLLFSTSFFDAQECNLHANRYGEDWASGNANGCDSLVLDAFTFRQVPNMVYASLFVVPIGLGAIMLSYSNRSYVEPTSFAHFLTGLFAFMAAIPVLFFFAIWGFMDNQYYIETRCPPNTEGVVENCSFIQDRYNLVQVENSVNAGLGIAMIVAASFYVKMAYDMIDGYETART